MWTTYTPNWKKENKKFEEEIIFAEQKKSLKKIVAMLRFISRFLRNTVTIRNWEKLFMQLHIMHRRLRYSNENIILCVLDWENSVWMKKGTHQMRRQQQQQHHQWQQRHSLPLMYCVPASVCMYELCFFFLFAILACLRPETYKNST